MALLSLAFIGLAVLFPLIEFVRELLPSDEAAMGAWREQLFDPALLQAALVTLGVGLAAVALATLFSVPCAFMIAYAVPPVQTLVQLTALLPLAIPPFVTAALLSPWLPDERIQGLLSVDAGVAALVVVYALHFFPLLLFGVIAGINNIDRDGLETARNLDLPPLTRVRQIFVPRVLPLYILAATILLLEVIEDIGAPLLLKVDSLLAPRLLSFIGEVPTGNPAAGQSALLLLALASAITLLAWQALQPTASSDTGPRRTGPLARRGSLAVLLTLPPVLLVMATAMLPMIALLTAPSLTGNAHPASLTAALQTALAAGTLPNTLLFAAGCGLLLTLIASLQATTLHRSGLVSAAVRVTTIALFAVPGVVLAMAYRQIQGTSLSWLPTWLPSAWVLLGLVIVVKMLPYTQHLLIRWPFVVRQDQLNLARCHGMSSPYLFARIIVPAFITLIVALWLLGFSAAVWELSAALVLLDGGQLPMAMDTFETFRDGTALPTLGAQGLLLGAITGLSLLVAVLLLQKHRRQRPPRVSKGKKV